MKRFLMSTAILPNFGTYQFEKLTLEQASELAKNSVSAIGHDSTAEVLSELFGYSVPKNRLSVSFEVGDSAVVFKLNNRPPEGTILDREALENIGFTFGLITRLK